MNEATLQRRVVSLLRVRKLLFCHVPNGGPRDTKWAQTGRTFGIYPGVPDLLVFTPTKQGHVGLALELKSARGKTSKAQERWLRELRAAGWFAVVADDYAKVVALIDDLY
jgi:hypothetical protein